MKVYFVGAGPGDPELLTIKAQRLLCSTRCCIYAGSLVSHQVLALLPENCEKYDSASLSLNETIAIMQSCQEHDLDVVRLHTGEPALFGAIAEQMRELEKSQIAFEVIPGISSFQAAAAAIQTELTAPDIAQTVILSRIAGRTPVPPEQELEHLAATRSTLCLFLSVHKMENLTQTLIPYYGETCPIAVVYRASWPDQVIVEGTLANIVAQVKVAGITRTAMILVGPALRRQGGFSKLYDETFSHGYRKSQQ
jgi:precorrin-4/cobalt-precorrin-4 C11-methyltransferase